MGVSNDDFKALLDFTETSPTITFLGGPLDGTVVEPDVQPTLDLEWPDWFAPQGSADVYIRACPCHLPDWVVTPPHMDMLDTVYIWRPYLGSTEGGGGTPAEVKPEPLSL